MQPILMTKLYIPDISENSVIRKTQLDKLKSGFNKNNQLSLVCAPAGYGKTTLILEFLHKLDTQVAWISLDEGDNDAQRFLVYLITAIKNAGIDVGSDILTLATDISFSNTDTVLTMLINCIAGFGKKLIIVLDDYHLIRSPRINEMLKFILEHQPINLHMIIISREDPGFPLAKLRMKGKLTEVRLSELLFTNEEANEFLQKEIGIHFNSLELEKVTAKTEGWIAGLQLAALLLKDYPEDEIEDFIRKFDGTNSYIIDYLVEEVLTQLEPEQKTFLCRTSILERMNDKLCNELLGRLDSREMLTQLEKKNLFLIPLDQKKEWYRYHHLFADSLRTYLSEEEEQDMYQKASTWMKKNGYSHEAVRYAFKSKNLQLAVKMVEDSTEEAFQNAQLESLLEWLRMLPEELVINNEILCIRKGIALFIVGRLQEGIEYLNSFGEDFYEKTTSHNKGLILSLRAMIANIQGQDAEALASEALQYLEPWDPIARVSAMNSLGRARYLKGKVTGAMEAFEQAYEAGRKLGYQFVTTLALMNYSSCLLVMAQSDKALTQCNQYIEGMRQQYDSLPPYIGVIYLVMAEAYGTLGEQEKADHYKENGLALCNSISFDGEGSLSIYKRNIGSGKPIDNEEEALNVTEAINLEYGEKLSERELEILKLLIRGLSNQEIADKLFITINTAQWHLSHIYSKLGVKSRTQAIIKAKELGL